MVKVVAPAEGRGHVARRVVALARGEVAPFGRGRRAACVRRRGVGRAGEASSHLVRLGSPGAITCLSACRASVLGPGASAAESMHRWRVGGGAARPVRGPDRLGGRLDRGRAACQQSCDLSGRQAAEAIARR